ncbi:MAG: hypothetical protein QOD84_2215 [Acidobacteriaceae bacterium]|jgi:hypothetical protein
MKVASILFAYFAIIPALLGADYQHATNLRAGSIYLSPDPNSTKLSEVDRGREIVVLETSRDWAHVQINLAEERSISGWMPANGIVQASTPNGDKILFGEAIDSEEQASRNNGRHGAAQDALRLYYQVFELFPSSPLAAEAAYRSADIRWQMEKPDIMARPSAKELDPSLREGMEEKYMKEVIKKFPGTKWGDLASFHLIDNKVCGDWQGRSKCPAKEAEIYEKYANEHPQSPSAAEALYNATWRWSALIEIYKSEDQAKKSSEAKSKAVTDGQKLISQFPQSGWAARAQRLLYYMEQNIPTYGNGSE